MRTKNKMIHKMIISETDSVFMNLNQQLDQQDLVSKLLPTPFACPSFLSNNVAKIGCAMIPPMIPTFRPACACEKFVAMLAIVVAHLEAAHISPHPTKGHYIKCTSYTGHFIP